MANIIQVADRVALIHDDNGVLRAITPVYDSPPWWIDPSGNYYDPANFTWELT